jgi:hypothetical protein
MKASCPPRIILRGTSKTTKTTKWVFLSVLPLAEAQWGRGTTFAVGLGLRVQELRAWSVKGQGLGVMLDTASTASGEQDSLLLRRQCLGLRRIESLEYVSILKALKAVSQFLP